MATAAPEKKNETEKKNDKVEKPKASKYKFKLLFGMYVSTEYKIVTNPETGEKTRKPENTIYQADPKKGVFPIINTDIDLESYNGKHRHMKKFEKIIGSATQTIVDPTVRLEGESIHAYLTRMEDMVKSAKAKTEEMMKGLDKLTQEELVSLAAQEEVDISTCQTVGDVRKVLREALTS